MGRKKRKGAQLRPFCYYCDREFDDEKVLIQHQKAKHFKCSECNRKLDTATGLIVHMLQVHKETVSRVPNANPGHDNPELIIHGMAGVPLELLTEKQASLDAERGSVKQQKTAHTVIGMSVMNGFLNQMNAAGMPGLMPSVTQGTFTNPMLFNQFMTQFAQNTVGAAAASSRLNAGTQSGLRPGDGSADTSAGAQSSGGGLLTQNWNINLPGTTSAPSKVELPSALGNLARSSALLVFDMEDDQISPEELLAQHYGYSLESTNLQAAAAAN